MNMPSFQNKMRELFPEDQEQDQSELLKTIRMPKNLMYLSNRLPNPTYDKHNRNQNNNTFKINRNVHHKKGQNSVNPVMNTGNSNQSPPIQLNEDLRLPHLQNKNTK